MEHCGAECTVNYLLLQGGGGGAGMDASFFVMMGAIFIVMYFFMIRPQQKKAKEQKNFLGEINKGDRVVTIGGIYGKVLRVDEDSFLVEVDANTKLRITKASVSYESTKAAFDSEEKTDKKEKADKKPVKS